MGLPRLLVVDDDPDVCEMLRLAFSTAYEVTTESDGRRALERLEEIAPDVAIVDLVLPGADGLTVCERIRAARPETLLVIITATTRESDLPDSFWRMGTPADAFVSKPFDLQRLVAKVHDLRVKRVEEKRASEKPPPNPLPPLAPDEPPE